MPPRPEEWQRVLHDMFQRAHGDVKLLLSFIEEEFQVRLTERDLDRARSIDVARKLWREIEKSEPPF